MGKVSDALERHKKERFINAERLGIGRTATSIDKGPELPPASELNTQYGFSPKLVAYSAPGSLDAENFKVLRSHILFPKDGDRPKTIMVTSAFPGEGKTFVAANLAVSLAMGLSEYVLLVDCDFRRPDLHSMLGHPNTEGFYEYLAGKRRLHDVLIKTKVEKLSLLTAGRPLPNHSELLSSVRMKEFLEKVEARNQDHFIIIDAAPSQVTSEAGVLANYVDAIIFVVMARRSPRKAIQRNIESLGRKKILGIVFNGYSESYKSYHRYYRRYYKQQIA